MNPIKAAGRAFRSQNGFTYVMDSTLWECDSCGERVTYVGRKRHAKQCPERSFKAMMAETETIGELTTTEADHAAAGHEEADQAADTGESGQDR